MDDKQGKEKILQGAKELFRKYGVRSITMDDIAHHLGISKKTIYQFFTDKDDIVYLAVKMHVQQEREVFTQVKASATHAIDLLYQLTGCIRDNMKETNTSLVFDLQKYHPKAWALVQQFKYGFVLEIIAEALQRGVDEGYFQEDIAVDVLARMRLETVSLLHDDQVFPRTRYTLVQLHAVLFDHFVQGIATDKGRKGLKKYKEQNSGR